MEQTNVGVFIPYRKYRRIVKQRPHHKFVKLVRANRKAKVNLYFFSLRGVNVTKQTIQGVYYDNKQKRWRKEEFPYPHVLYRRGLMSSKKGNKLSTFYNQLKEAQVKMINRHTGFNKWKVYNRLKAYPEMKPFLPFTTNLEKERDLKELLDGYGKIYAKAYKGNRGRKVVKISKQPNGVYELSSHKRRIQKFHFQNVSDVIHQVYHILKTRKVLLQEGIDLVELNGSIVDLRGELQRNGDGEVEIVAVAARISRKNSPITTHASSYPLEDFLSKELKYSRSEVDRLQKRIREFLLNVYQCVEEEYGTNGELGIDFGMDKSGKLWFIEVNAQTAKVSLMKAFDRETVDRAFLNLLEYAKYVNQQ